MGDINQNDKPCLVNTGQGLSILYKNRYIYSKYSPKASAEKLASSIEIPPNTLVLCFSPVLGYGLDILAKKIPETSFALIIEEDSNLFSLYDEQNIPPGFGIINPKDVPNIMQLLSSREGKTSNRIIIPKPGTFKRSLRLDFSGATNINAANYKEIQQNVDEVIATFWKNRMTLVKMGRLYHRNLFRNISKLPFAKEIELKSIEKPIIILGAGPSVDEMLELIAKMPNSQREKLFLIAVDAVLTSMVNKKVFPDLLVAQECQFAIQKAYLGTKKSNVHIIADISSRPSILRNESKSASYTTVTGGGISFFTAEFCDTNFLNNLRKEKLLPIEIPPLGSVGITATELALLLRKAETVPIFVCGLDFSFPAGKTHSKGAYQSTNQILRGNRLNPVGNPSAAFAESCFMLKNENNYYSNYTMSHYGKIFASRYNKTKNIFSVNQLGFPLGLKNFSKEEFFSSLNLFFNTSNKTKNIDSRSKATNPEGKKIEKVKMFLENEKNALTIIKNYLSTGQGTKEEIEKLLEEREYLYLHFPDGHSLSMETQFLKRIRVEIDFFLKDINLSQKELSKNSEIYSSLVFNTAKNAD